MDVGRLVGNREGRGGSSRKGCHLCPYGRCIKARLLGGTSEREAGALDQHPGASEWHRRGRNPCLLTTLGGAWEPQAGTRVA